MQVDEVFGVAPVVNAASYVDRGGLDGQLAALFRRHVHVSISGESRSGKSWLRQRAVPHALVVQCREGLTVADLYRLAMNALGLRLDLSSDTTGPLDGHLSSIHPRGRTLLKNVLTVAYPELVGEETPSGISVHSNDHLPLIAAILRISRRRLVIEDFHYLSRDAQRLFASHLKSLWDLSTYVVVIGVSSRLNFLEHLNPELRDRQEAIQVQWTPEELLRVIELGARSLNVQVDPQVRERILRQSLGDVARLQLLSLQTVEELFSRSRQVVAGVSAVEVQDAHAQVD
ncbi:MAG: hypothetical protein JWR01_1566 [Subtercola sp.]|nr:hypothetical protein [Subtercola sp.]